ncbi:uncharacterized protein [Diadema antillarum]|uniref:uncharacterized protein n=2 Tax=Diadema antillarum TaxID=105358 RepID=UPI003A8A0208
MLPRREFVLILVVFLAFWSLSEAARGRGRRQRKQRRERQTVGCDGVLGSGLVVDKCGMCGGSNTDCQIFSGAITNDFRTIGYHTMVTIPAGAMYVNITETTKSRNYLALQTSAGDTVFNCNWRIDYPGNYSAGGTNVLYKRSARSQNNLGEQILIMGPTAVDLDAMIIYQQRNPGITYEYVIPNPRSTKQETPPVAPEEDRGQQTSQQDAQTTTAPTTTKRPTTTEPTTTKPTTTQPTTKPTTSMSTTVPTTTRMTTIQTTTPPTTPRPTPPVVSTEAPPSADAATDEKEKMSISTGVMPGQGMGGKEEPRGFARVETSSKPDSGQGRQGLGTDIGDSRYPHGPGGFSVGPSSALSGSASGSVTGDSLADRRLPQPQQQSPGETQGQGSVGTGSGVQTGGYGPVQGAGGQTRPGPDGRPQSGYVSSSQYGRGPTQTGSQGQPQTGQTDPENTQSRPFYGYFPNLNNPPETQVPRRENVLPVQGAAQQASQSSPNQPRGPNPTRTSGYNPNLPGGRTGSSGQTGNPVNSGTTAQSGLFAGSYNRGVPDSSRPYRPNYNSYQGGGYLPGSATGTYYVQSGGDQSRTGISTGTSSNPRGQPPRPGLSHPQPGTPTGEIVYNPNYRPPPNQGLPVRGGQGVPSRGQGVPPTYGQGVPTQNQGRPVVLGQGGSSLPSQGQSVPQQPPRPGTPNRYPWRPNQGYLPDNPSQPPSNLPQTGGQSGVSYPYPGSQQPSGPGLGPQDPQTNFSPFSAGVQGPLVPIGGEDAETFTSDDYSSSIPEEDQGNQATLGGNPNVPDPPVNQLASYIWMETGMTECSMSCAGGITESIVKCVQENSFYIAEDSMCVQTEKPPPRRRTCNNDPCPARWEAEEWGACSRTCGEGRQMRSVTCQQKVTQSIDLPTGPDQCRGLPKPAVVQTCRQRACASWSTGDWGACSSECGEGERQREVTCVDETRSELEESECSHMPKPDDTQDCDAGPCRAAWFTDRWSEECSAECGSGQFLRSVVCSVEGSSGGELPIDQCAGQEKPSAIRTCNNSPCGPRWFTSEWSMCSSQCGPGTQSREVVCLSSDPTPRIVSSRMCRGAAPPSSQPCEESPCEPHWYTTEWSECSRSCGGGHRTRHVKCLDGARRPSSDCERDSKPSHRQTCNIQQCVTIPQEPEDPLCTDKFSYCDMILQARLCLYSYYRQRCCHSCRSQQ